MVDVTVVVGDEAALAAVREATPDAQPVPASADALADAAADAVVAVGEPALLAAARAGVDAPVLPVDAGAGVGSVPRSALADAAAHLQEGVYDTRDLPLLAVTAGDADTVALFDVMLVTSEPARISEYRVRAADADGSPLSVSRFRADGVVVATPAGSQGYARDAGGAVVAPDIEAATVVPVAPFRLDHHLRWVVRFPVTLTVERDEGDVSLLVDDRTVGSVESQSPVTIGVDGALTAAIVPEANPVFGHPG